MYCASFITVRVFLNFITGLNYVNLPVFAVTLFILFSSLYYDIYPACVALVSIGYPLLFMTISFRIHTSFLLLTHRLAEFWSWYFPKEFGSLVMKWVTLPQLYPYSSRKLLCVLSPATKNWWSVDVSIPGYTLALMSG